MIPKEVLIKISDVIWEIPKSYRSDMQVPARFFATERMIDEALKDKSLDQLVNVATLRGIQGQALAMPDMHEGYGFPIGGVAAMSYPDGVISPGGIGYDVNCGIRLMRSHLKYADVKDHLENLSKRIYHVVPSGVGEGGPFRLSKPDMDGVLRLGIEWMVKQGFATENDARHIESFGRLENADPSKVSDQAKERGQDQLGTLGSGNHFAEIDVVDQIYDEQAAGAFGLYKDQIVIMVHCGSRGLGHQVATDYIRIMMKVMEGYGITLPDRELACVPFSSPEGTDYFNAMAAAANFAWSNRQFIMHNIRQAWKKELGEAGGDLSLVYDVAHNMAKIETHDIATEGLEGSALNKKQKVIMHRKGATRAFGPGHPELAQEYRAIGQPVLIPGSMGTASYVLVGTEQGMSTSFGSCCHGAGRVMSRAAAKKLIHGRTLREQLLKEQGIYIQTDSMVGLAEEAPNAYKDVDEVVGVVAQAGIAGKVARLRPCAVVKG